MKIHFFGTGTSTGNPEIGCTCEVCKSLDKRDRRLRSSILIETNGKRILIDCGPDFREQIIVKPFSRIDAVLLTHEHYDHVGGIDDLRPFNKFGDVDIYAESYVADALIQRMPYCFQEIKYPGIPNIVLNKIDLNPFDIDGVGVTPIRLRHQYLPILGYRIGDLAYLTDLKCIPETEFSKLVNLDILIIDCLRIEEHQSHLNLEQAIEYIRKINPQKAFLIHMSHHIGLHSEVEKILPENVFLPYDGLIINTNDLKTTL